MSILKMLVIFQVITVIIFIPLDVSFVNIQRVVCGYALLNIFVMACSHMLIQHLNLEKSMSFFAYIKREWNES